MQLPLRYRFLLFLAGIRNWFVAKLISLTLWIIRLIPLKYAARMFERFARWFGPKIWRHKVVMDNLAIAFPEKSIEERNQLARDNWAQMARSVIEYIYLDEIFDLNEDHPESDLIEIKNAEIYA